MKFLERLFKKFKKEKDILIDMAEEIADSALQHFKESTDKLERSNDLLKERLLKIDSGIIEAERKVEEARKLLAEEVEALNKAKIYAKDLLDQQISIVEKIKSIYNS